MKINFSIEQVVVNLSCLCMDSPLTGDDITGIYDEILFNSPDRNPHLSPDSADENWDLLIDN